MNKLPILILTIICFMTIVSSAQVSSITLEECYRLARENYPLTRQHELILKSESYNVDNASKGYIPQVNLLAQASYQSEVVHLPIDIPGNEFPLIPKDQYKVYGEIKQTILDGGVISNEKEYYESNARAEAQKLEVELYKLNERINQLFFGILLIDEQLRQLVLIQNDIEIGLHKAEALIGQGSALKSSASVLKAELLNAHQRNTELNTLRHAYVEMLSLMIHQPLEDNTLFIKPMPYTSSDEIQRPELSMFDYQQQSIAAQTNLLTATSHPKLNLLIQAGVGRPGINVLDDQFMGYYMGSLQFVWPIAGTYTLKNEKADMELKQQSIQLQRETFLFNTHLALNQQDADILKYHELLSSDDEIIALRTEIKNTALVQMENGVITSQDYLQEVNAEDKARQNKILHEIQWLMAQYNKKTTSGN